MTHFWLRDGLSSELSSTVVFVSVFLAIPDILDLLGGPISLLIVYFNIYGCFTGVSRLPGPIDACAYSGYLPRREGPEDPEASIIHASGASIASPAKS